MAIGTDEKIDWFRVIVDLCALYGYTLSTIAISIKVARSTVFGWKQGAAPKYEEGDRLIDLWAHVTGESRETVHRVKRHSYRA